MGARSAPPGQTNGTVTTTRSPRHRTRPAACRRAQGRRYSGVVDAGPRLVSLQSIEQRWTDNDDPESLQSSNPPAVYTSGGGTGSMSPLQVADDSPHSS